MRRRNDRGRCQPLRRVVVLGHADPVEAERLDDIAAVRSSRDRPAPRLRGHRHRAAPAIRPAIAAAPDSARSRNTRPSWQKFSPPPRWGRVWVGVTSTQILGDHRLHAIRVLEHLVVPEPQYAVALPFKEARATRLLFRGRIMLAAIDFHDQFRLVADKVGNKAPQRHLTAKSDNLRFGANAASARSFSRLRSSRGATPWLARERRCSDVSSFDLYDRARHHPHPALPHRGGGSNAVTPRECAAIPFRQKARAIASAARYRERPGSGRRDRARRRRPPRGTV